MIAFKIYPQLLCLFLVILPLASGAQSVRKAASQKTWDDRNKTLPDTSRLSAGMDLASLYLETDPDSALIIGKAIEAYGQQNANNKWLANAWIVFGNYYQKMGLPDSSHYAFLNAMQYTKSESEPERAEIYSKFGLVYAMQNQLDSAVYYLHRGIDLVRKHRHPTRMLAGMYNILSATYSNQDKILEAIEAGQESIKYGDDINNTKAYFNIGSIFMSLALYDEARFNFNKSKECAERTGSSTSLILTYVSLIQMAENPGTIDTLVQTAMALADRQKSGRSTVEILFSAALQYTAFEKYDLAAVVADRCLDSINVFQLDVYRPGIQRIRANILYQKGQYQASLKLCHQIESEIEAVENQNRAEIYDLLSRNYEAVGNLSKAIFYTRKKEEITNTLENHDFLGEIVRVYFKKQAEQTQLLLQAELDKTNLIAAAKQKRSRTMFAALLSLTILLSAVAFLIYYYYRQRSQSAQRLMILNTKLNQEKEKLKSYNNKLKRFSNIISHDILSSMDLILSTGNVLVPEKNASGTVNQYYDITQSTIRQLKNYCLDLLHEAQETNTTPKLFDPMPALRRVLERYAAPLAAANFKQEIGILPASALPQVVVEQIFNNLISNALNHAGKGPSPLLRIVSQEEAPGETIWVIEDSGPGIEADQRTAIFSQKNHTPSAKGNGRHKGLFLLSRTLQEYGAEIRVEEADTGGARFVIKPKVTPQ